MYNLVCFFSGRPKMELRLLLRPLAVFLCFSVLDFILTTTSLGFYAPGFHFDISQIFDKLLLVGGFRIQTSAVEFVGFVFIRLIVTLGALVLITKRRFDDQLFYFLNVMAALTMSYSLVKGKRILTKNVEVVPVQHASCGLCLFIVQYVFQCSAFPRSRCNFSSRDVGLAWPGTVLRPSFSNNY